jgi:hypothetical protein
VVQIFTPESPDAGGDDRLASLAAGRRLLPASERKNGRQSDTYRKYSLSLNDSVKDCLRCVNSKNLFAWEFLPRFATVKDNRRIL